MIDREKLIKGFECCHVMVHDLGPDKTSCGICPYKDVQTEEQIDLGGIECIAVLHDDALALLKEQETANLYKCPNCGTWVSAENVVRCKDCEHHKKDTCSAAGGMAFPPPDDWFCADGERKKS